MSPATQTQADTTSDDKPGKLTPAQQKARDAAVPQAPNAPKTTEADIPLFGGGVDDGTVRHAVRSLQGPRVIALEALTPDGGHKYLLVEPLGDPDMYATYLVKAVDGNPDAFDVEYGGPGGTWARLLIESGPLTVPDYVE